METTLEQIRRSLRENADAATRDSARRFFKEPVMTYGVKTSIVTQIAKQTFAQLKTLPKQELLACCEELWRSGYLEEGGIACEWAYALRKQYEPKDFALFSRWVDAYVHNWAMCDVLCNHSVGSFIQMYPEFVTELKTWTASPNRWKKRAAAVTLIIPARKGLFLAEAFAIADSLLADTDDLVQKGYGWLLKAASEAHPAEVFAYVLSKKESMPRTAFRYALEKMPKEWRAQAMKK